MYIADDELRDLYLHDRDKLNLLIGLYLKADKEGVVETSRSKMVQYTGLTERRYRTALSKLDNVQVNVQVSSKLTISNIDDYRVLRPRSVQDDVQVKDKENKTKENSPLTPIKKEKEKEKENTPCRTHVRARFKTPSVEEVLAYCKEKGYHLKEGAQYFIDFYETNGWVQGKSRKPIKDWKACVRTWVRNSKTERYQCPENEIGCIIHSDDNRVYETNGWDDVV